MLIKEVINTKAHIAARQLIEYPTGVALSNKGTPLPPVVVTRDCGPRVCFSTSNYIIACEVGALHKELALKGYALVQDDISTPHILVQIPLPNGSLFHGFSAEQWAELIKFDNVSEYFNYLQSGV